METKKCRECNIEKPLSEYYKHKEMFDGHLNKCKECVKSRVSRHREDNIEAIQEYDRNRPNSKERSKKNNERVKNYTGKQKANYDTKRKKWFSKNKNKKIVNTYLANAIRGKRKEKGTECEHCGDKNIPLDGHHPSYLNPLDVIWLCKPCHGAEHKKINAIKRGVA